MLGVRMNHGTDSLVSKSEVSFGPRSFAQAQSYPSKYSRSSRILASRTRHD